jgi:hypothetical protein
MTILFMEMVPMSKWDEKQDWKKSEGPIRDMYIEQVYRLWLKDLEIHKACDCVECNIMKAAWR